MTMMSAPRSGQHGADRGGDPATLRRGLLEFGHRLMPRRQPGRKDPPVPVAGDNAPPIAREFVGELLRVADAEDLRARISPQTPCRKCDRRQQRLQMARRQVDDQPRRLAIKHRCQLRRDDLDMRAERERGPRVELAKTPPHKVREVAPQ
jgi:hypothetical protein